MRVISWLFCSLVVLGCARAETRVVGCDLLGSPFVDALAAFARSEAFSVRLSMDGSRTGSDQLATGAADIALLLVAPGRRPEGDGLVSIPVAYLAPVVVVPSGVPLAQATLTQLSGVYCEDDGLVVRRWADLGVAGDWAAKPIQAHLPDGAAGLVGDLFRNEALRSMRLRPGVVLTSSLDEQTARLVREQGGIGVVPATLLPGAGLKALALARAPGDTAFGPTPEAIHRGDYPVRLPLWVTFRRAEAGRWFVLLRYLLGEDMEPVWRTAGFVPLPLHARNQQVFELELLCETK